VKHQLSRCLFFCFLTFLALGILHEVSIGFAPIGVNAQEPSSAKPSAAAKVVFLGGEMNREDLITFASAVHAKGGVLLLDSPKNTLYPKTFLKAYRPDRVIPVGSFPDGILDLERRLDICTEPAVPLGHGHGLDLWLKLFPQADQIVLCPAEPRSIVLQAAALAGALKAPLFIYHGIKDDKARLQTLLETWKTQEILAVGTTADDIQDVTGVEITPLATEKAVSLAYIRSLAQKSPIRNFVVANPADCKEESGGMSSLAPWIALERHAALLLTNPKGDNVEELVHAAELRNATSQADTLILVAGLQALPMKQRPNPIPADKDASIDMEPLTPTGTEPFSYAVGRLFHEEPGVVTLMMARQRLLVESPAPRKALVASNPGGSLQLLEVFSRNTVKELRNAGYETTTLFGKQINKDDLRSLLQENDLFLWEGHHNTLIKDYGFPEWDEPLPPSLVFLQSCLALKEPKVQPLLRHGAIGVIGSSTRVYSGSGGACSLAFLDGLLYEGQSLGGALRQAKNFLLAYSLLKEKRLGDQAKRGGANVRSAWAFSLWGDPTLMLPRPERPAGALPPVSHEVHGNVIVLSLPPEGHDRVFSDKFQAQVQPNGRLAGLVLKAKDEDGQPLVPFVFAEVSLPKAPDGMTPRLNSRLPSSRYVFTWDERRHTGYLLAMPRTSDHKELRFNVHWEAGTGRMN
jgi:Peptidase family C25